MSALVVITTAPRNKAGKIAKALIRRRLAACVQVDEVGSFYRWKGKIEHAGEMRLTIKTRAELYGAVETAIREMTPYETPEILAHPVVAGSADYLEWIEAETGEGHD